MKKILSAAFLLLASFTSQSQNIALIGHLNYAPATCAGVWHYVDSLGNEYALVGANNRISIVDVTVPSSPTEKFTVPALSGQTSLWRELKTYGKYAYSVSEGGGGIIIVNLSYLPDSISYKHWYGDGAIAGQLTTGHTIAVTDGYIYDFGTNLGNGGAIIADISDPWNPHYVGQFNQDYIHDGYIRNDTLWAGFIYSGKFGVIDVTNKSNPVLLTSQQTPGQFCHNVWLSDNSKYLFTTDEQHLAPLGSFDVTNINNIQLKTVYYADSLPDEEVHNTRVLNDFLINPSYGSHLTIVDAARPENLIEIANATSITAPGQSFLCWDASPYLPSGNIIATDTYGGLFIYQPTYTRACYLEGKVIDSITTAPLNGVLVEIVGTPRSTTSNLTGDYKTGIPDSGTFDIRFSKPGYITKVYSNISLANGVLTLINVELVPFMLTGNVSDQLTLIGLPNANVSISDGVNTFNTATDANGNYTLSGFVSGIYTVSAAKWGYVTQCITTILDGTTPANFVLGPGYMDDFATANPGWTVNSTATTGVWVRAIPVGTIYTGLYANPPSDVNGDCSTFAYVTGNGGGTATTDDVDNGYTVLTSPVFDLTTYINPYINYDRWFFINSNVSPSASDTMFITVSNGTTSVQLEAPTLNTPDNGTWVQRSFRVLDYIQPTATMTFQVFAEDKPGSGNIVEGGLDNFIVSEGPLSVPANTKEQVMQVFPNPSDDRITVKLNGEVLTGKSYVTITDMTGRIVARTPSMSSETIIYVDKLPPGIYILRAENMKTGIQPLRIIKR